MTTQTYRLEVEVNAGGAKSAIDGLKTSLNDLDKSASKTEQAMGELEKQTGLISKTFTSVQNTIKSSFSNIGNAFQKFSNDGTKAKAVTNDLDNAIKKLGSDTDVAAKKLDGLQKGGRDLSGAFSQLKGTFGSLQGLMGFSVAGIGIANILQTADAMKTLDTQIKLVTGSEQEHAAVKSKLFDIANKTQQSFESAIGAYTNNARALGQLGKSQAEVLQFTENVSLAMAVGGKSAQEQASALLQLGQAMQSGVLQGDEFKSIAENSPILLDLIAQKLGKTHDEVRKLASDGKITSEVIFQSLIGATDKLNTEFAKMPMTMSGALTLLQNQYVKFVDDFVNQTGGLGEIIAKVIAVIAKNFNSILTIATAGAVIFGAKMLLGSAQVKEFAASVLTKTTAMRADAAETIRNAYSLETYNQANIRLIHTKNLLSQRLAVARLAKLHYSMSIKEAWATTTGYIQSQLTLTNAKNITTAAITRATGAVVGFGRATATNIIAAASYTQSLFTINGAKTAFIGATRVAISGVVGFGSAVKAGTVSVAQYTHALMTSTVAKRAFVGTASLAGTAVGKIGTAFAAVGRIIMAHPIMIIGGIITAVIVRTMGLQKAMESLSDAVNLVGSMLGDLVDVGIDGFKWLGSVADDFFSSLISGGGQSTGVVSGFFGDLFAGTEGGFVGLIQVIAKLLDSMANFFGRTIHSVHLAFVNLWNAIAQGAARAFNAAASAIETVINGVLRQYDRVINTIGGMVDKANAAAKSVGLDGVVNIPRPTASNTQISIGRATAATVEVPRPYQETQAITNYVNAKAALGKATKAAQKSQNGLNQALGKTAGAAKDAANKLSDASKKAAAATNEVNDAIAKLQKDIALFGKDDPLSALQYDIDKGKYTGVAQEKLQELKTLTEQFYTLQKNESVKDKMLAIDEKIYALGKNEVEILAYQLDHAKEYKGVSEKVKQSYLERTKALLEAEKVHERIKKIEESEKSLNKAKYELKHFGDAHAGTRWELKDQGYNDEEIGKIIGHEKAKEDIGRLSTLFDQLKNNQAFGNVGVTAQIDGVGGGFDFAGQMLGQSFDIAQKFEEQNALLKAAREQGLIDEADYLKRSEQLTAAHVEAKGQLMQTATQSVLGGITGIMKNVYGEQSKHYKIAFAMEKAYSVATIIMKQKEALAKAWASAPFPANLGAVASTLASTGALAAAVNAIRPVGQAHDGIMSVPKSGTWNLEKGERVLPKHTAKALDAKLDSMGSGGQTVIVNVTVNSDGTANVDSQAQIGKQMGEAIKVAVQQEMIKQTRQGGLFYGR